MGKMFEWIQHPFMGTRFNANEEAVVAYLEKMANQGLEVVAMPSITTRWLFRRQNTPPQQADSVPTRGTQKYIFFDTETNGLPRDYKAPPSADDNWPRLVQLAWLVCDDQGTVLRESSEIIKPVGFAINPQASAVHGITQQRALAEGVNARDVISRFWFSVETCPEAVAHNIPFDSSVIESEALRQGLVFPALPTWGKIFNCTMAAGTNICKIPGPRGYKWPKLAELYRHLFGEELEGAHDALVDVKACARCFFEIRRRVVAAEIP